MDIDIRREEANSLPIYASIPIGFDVHEVVDIDRFRIGDSTLRTRALASPRRKDYDAIAGNDPLSWPSRFDVQSWVILAAYSGDLLIGGAITVTDSDAVAPTGERRDFAVLWDLRVAPAWRKHGVGQLLTAAAEREARTADCLGMIVETQDTNVPACRLYAACGYTLQLVEPDAYADAPGEARLVWTKRFV